jgi:putative membrane protein
MTAIGFAGLLLVMAPAFAKAADTAGAADTASTKTTTSSHTNPVTGTNTTTIKTKTKPSLNLSDRRFLTEAAEGGMMEVELGKLAADKATDPDVKSFGQRMVDDHTKANDKIKQIAAEKGVTLPTELGVLDKHTLDKLQKESGSDFDRLYASTMVKDHKKDVSDFQHESKAAKDDDVKTFATHTLPTLKEHLKLAESAANKVSASTKHASTKKTSKAATSSGR